MRTLVFYLDRPVCTVISRFSSITQKLCQNNGLAVTEVNSRFWVNCCGMRGQFRCMRLQSLGTGIYIWNVKHIQYYHLMHGGQSCQ